MLLILRLLASDDFFANHRWSRGPGDDETGGTALETALRGQLQLIVRKNMHLRQPRAETPTEFITMGADSDFTAAAKLAVQDMIDLLMEKASLSRSETNRIAGIAADLHISEVADEKVGAYTTIAKSVLRSLPRKRRANGNSSK
jgi:acetamidase/formamidase